MSAALFLFAPTLSPSPSLRLCTHPLLAPPVLMDKMNGATAFVLDTSKLTIGTVTVDGERARWVQHRRHSVYGSALDIRLPGAETDKTCVKGQLLQVRACVCVCIGVCFIS